MTDPLRPFTDLIRSLWATRAAAPQRTANAAGPRSAAQGSHAPPGEALRSRLQARAAEIGSSNPRRAREIFVESVLTWELGDALASDPAFADVVRQVAEQLGADPRLERRLAELLDELSQS